MKHNYALLSLLLLANAALVAQDECATAVAVTPGTYTVAAVDGVEGPTWICPPSNGSANNAEWYTFIAGADTTMMLTTDLPGSGGTDTRFHVYTGTCGNLLCHSGDDDSGSGFTSTAFFTVNQGVQYTIAFDNHWSSNGFQFQLSEYAAPANALSFIPQGIALNGSRDCVVDMNGDHLDDVVGVSSNNVHMLLQQPGGTFTSVNTPTPPADHTASWSIAAGDLDNNGFTDLLYGGGSGATIMLANSDGTAFTEISPPQYIFSQRTNMVDINNDGWLDAFVCHDVDPNVYFINDGMGGFITNQGGLGIHPSGGNYGSIWTDFDNDGDVDMFISKCGSADINEMHINNGNGTYTEMAAAFNLADPVQTWSSSVGDFDRDGDMDIVVGASSTWSGGHKVMRNDGNTFTDVTAGSGFDVFTGTTIEWITKDFDNDGHLDILGAGALMLGNGDLTFTQTSITPSNGPIGDLNNDGFLDIQNGNTLYMNAGNDNHWIRIYPVGTQSNIDGIGARVEVVTPNATQIRDIRSGEGFGYMSSMAANFGLGEETTITEVNVYWPSGIVNTVYNPSVDQGLEIIEGVSVGVEESSANTMSVYPNPATDQLFVRTNDQIFGTEFQLYSGTGALVQSGTMNNAFLDISELSEGVYILSMELNTGRQMQRFTKINN